MDDEDIEQEAEDRIAARDRELKRKDPDGYEERRQMGTLP